MMIIKLIRKEQNIFELMKNEIKEKCIKMYLLFEKLKNENLLSELKLQLIEI
jgi:hypothetical protein